MTRDLTTVPHKARDAVAKTQRIAMSLCVLRVSDSKMHWFVVRTSVRWLSTNVPTTNAPREFMVPVVARNLW